jgi:Fur family transcriptional regulator, ferric uptake regulator
MITANGLQYKDMVMVNLLQESKKRLNAGGGRMTVQRRLILETLGELGGHPSVEEIYDLARQTDPSLHLTTVYRTLRWLEREGLVSSCWFEDERHQERFDPGQPGEHYHFLCTSCKAVIEFDNLLVNTIKAQFELHTGAQVDIGRVVLYGLCAPCRDRQEK